MCVVRILKGSIKFFTNPTKMGIYSNLLAAVYMLTAMYVINIDVPNRVLTNKALTALLGIGVLMLVYFWGLYIRTVLKRWNAEGFTFNLKLADDDKLPI